MSPAIHFELVSKCPDCGSRLDLRCRKSDGAQFAGCSAYPRCKFTADAGDQYLRRELLDARDRIRELEREPIGGSAILGRRLREVIAFAHPDRHLDGMVDAHEITARLNAIRQEVLA